MAKLLAACRTYLVILALLWPHLASARAGTLAVCPEPMAEPMLSAETLTGEPIGITSLEVNSVVVGPLIASNLTIGLASHPGAAELRVRLPRGAVVLEWERDTIDCGDVPSAFAAGTWSKLTRSHRASLIIAQPLLHGQAVVVSVAERAALARLEATLTDDTGSDLAEPVVATDVSASSNVIAQVEGIAEAYRAGELTMVNAHVGGEATSTPIRDAIVLLDTSASSAQELSHRIEQAQAIARVSIGHLALVTFDQSTEVVFQGKANDFNNSAFEAMARRGALGATNLENTFQTIEGLARHREYQRVILLTDGVVTVGSRNRAALSSLIQRWGKFGIRRLDVVAPQFGGDRDLLDALVATSLPEHGRVISDSQSLVVQLEQPSTRDLPVSILAAVAQKPWGTSSPEPNNEQWILARIPQGNPLRLRVGFQAPKLVEAQPAWRPLLERYFELQRLLPASEDSKRDRFVLERGRLSISNSRRMTLCAAFNDWTSGRMPPEAIQRIVRLNFGRFRGCATQNHRAPIVPKGRVTVRFVIGNDGSVTSVTDVGSTVRDEGFVRCVLEAFTTLRFAPPPDGPVTVVYPLIFVEDEQDPSARLEDSHSYANDIPQNYVPVKLTNPEYPLSPRDVGLGAYEGELRTVMEHIRANRLDVAERVARALLQSRPNALVSYLAWGKLAEAHGQLNEARRAYGSLIDRFDGNPRLLRVAAAWLAHLGNRTSRALAAVALKKTLSLKDERVRSERQLAWLHVEDGDYEAALELLTEAFLHQEDREPSLLNQEISMVAAAALAQHPAREAAIMAQLRRSGTPLAQSANLIIALESDTDRSLALSIYTSDKHGRFHATSAYSYNGRTSAYEIAPAERRTPYTLRVAEHAWRGSRWETSGLGFVRILDYDGKRNVHGELRPFIIQTEGAEVDLGTYGNDAANTNP